MCFECGGCKGSIQIIHKVWAMIVFPFTSSGTWCSGDLRLWPQALIWCTRSISLVTTDGHRPNPRRLVTGHWMQLSPFHPRIDKRHTFCVFPPEVRRRRVLFRSVSGKRTWKYTELVVIICEGLFTFKGNAEGKKGRQTQDEGLGEGLVCESNGAG